ncbi:MAG: class I SAM-dependent methyltransferase [Acidobacteriota bacterium]
MFLWRRLNPDEVERLRKGREEADRRYNEALTALDSAIPPRREVPHPPPGYDEHQVTPLNERWEILASNDLDGLGGWRGRVARVFWPLLRPLFERQQAFNSALVDHVNRNVPVHRAARESAASALAFARDQMELAAAFYNRLILYLQTVTAYIDTKDRDETQAQVINGLSAGIDAVSQEMHRRWEAMQAREQRFNGALDELRTSVAAVQQTGLVLKRELERLLHPAARPTAPLAAAQAPPPGAIGQAPAPVPPSPRLGVDELSAHRYLGFENKFRGSQESIRDRQASYVDLFAGASEVLDLGCGRGEFLALLKERGIRARGLDANHEMVEVCRAHNLEVDRGDALDYVASLPDGALGGLIAIQVVEHFPPPYLVRLLDVAYHKLRPGARIVLETVNPSSWIAFFEAYIRDITHAWPLHPETLKYLVVASGYQRVDVRFLSPVPADAQLQPILVPSAGATPLAVASVVKPFNDNIAKLNALLFGPTDYAIIGERL